ncbi:MAG TPA: hypothetical protein ENJ28_00125 [Gammaproteobacteria bacterium]|nr:hypothetical protein [Gammaproteobacteria bacterium]
MNIFSRAGRHGQITTNRALTTVHKELEKPARYSLPKRGAGENSIDWWCAVQQGRSSVPARQMMIDGTALRCKVLRVFLCGEGDAQLIVSSLNQ